MFAHSLHVLQANTASFAAEEVLAFSFKLVLMVNHYALKLVRSFQIRIFYLINDF